MRRWFDYDKAMDWIDGAMAIVGSSGDELVCDCPACSAEAKLWINENTGQFICFRCLWSGSLYDLVEDIENVSREQARIILGIDKGPTHAPVDMLEEVFSYPSKVEILTPETASVPTPDFRWFGFTKAASCAGEAEMAGEMLAALQSRGFDWDLIVKNRAGWCWEGRWAERVILPVYVEEKLVWWQAWDYTRQQKLKYRNPRNEEVPLSRKALLYNLERWPRASSLAVVEGIFNAWALEQVGQAATASFGKSLSSIQLLQLVRHPAQKFYVGLDPDAREQAVRICTVLRAHGKDAILCTLPYKKDWNDLPQQQRLAMLEDAGDPDWFFDAQPK